MAQNRNVMPSTRRVHEYWSKRIADDQDGMVRLIGDNAVTNILLGKGIECYACGHETSLQKCHIVPHGCGGGETVDNLFMMCLRCHQDNPDTVYKDLFFKYVREKKSYLNYMIDTALPYFLSSVAEASDEDRAKIDAFVNLPEKQQTAHHMKVPYMSICAGLNNRMSFNTLLGGMWKNILENDFTPKSPRKRQTSAA